MMIRKMVFSGGFAKDNCELFGYKENRPEDYNYYINGQLVTDPKELKMFREMERMSRTQGDKTFTGGYESVLPPFYWDIINSLEDREVKDILGKIVGTESSFVPNEKEGPIKKLRLF